MPLSAKGESSVDAGTTAAAPDKSESEEREERELLELLKRATLGEYDIYALLGRGGMASVFRAMELSLNRWVAIKVISPSALSSATVIDRFWLEARTAASLSHPNIIPIFAVRAIEGLHFFVMKHIQGGSLDVVLKTEGPLAFPVVRTVLTQVAGALAYAHRRGVIHRDIKPANIMLDEEGYAIVMDFGIAKVRDVAALTASGAMVGTPYYMSPEQFNGQQVDGRSDQYSLGCVAFELLTGVRPFRGESVPAVLRGHLLDKAPDVRSLRPNCPTSLATLINRMLCKAPSDRFASMEVLYGQLESMPRINADAMRDKITSLARTASSSNPQIREPQSPIPLSRTSGESVAPIAADSRQPSSLTSFSRLTRKRPWIAATLAGTGLLTAVVAWQNLSSASVSVGARKVASGPPVETPRTIIQPTGPGISQHIDSPFVASTLIRQLEKPKPDSIAQTKVKIQPAKSAALSEPRSVAQKKPTAVSPPAPTNIKQPSRGRTTQPEDQAPSSENRQPLLGMNPFPSAPIDPVLPPAPVRSPPAFTIGSRIPGAFLYIDGSQVGLLKRLTIFTHVAGQVHLQIRADDCLTWDTVITVSEGDTAKIGFRNPVCGK